jgi:hypothetical protein
MRMRPRSVALLALFASLRCSGSSDGDSGSSSTGGFGGTILPGDGSVLDVIEEPTPEAGPDASIDSGSDAPVDSGSDAPIDWITVDTPTDISQPGHYKVTQDLGANDSVITIHDTSDVVLDCDGHILSSSETTVGALHIDNVDNFQVLNCTLLAGIQDLKTYGLWLANSSNGNIAHNEIRATNVDKCDKLDVHDNTLHQYYQQYYSTECVVHDNLIYGDPDVTIAATIVFARGSKNQALDNQIDGKWNGDLGSTLAADDGVVIDNETNDLVANNLIINVWDCPLETVGYIEGTTFQNNTLAHAGYCCIGAWHWNSWRNNKVLDNACHDIGAMFVFQRYHGLADGETTVYFQDNEFSGNVQTPGGWEVVSRMDFQNVPSEVPPGSVVIGNNLMKNNTFTYVTPFLYPPSMFIDGGGNKCPKGEDPGFPLSCGKP